MKKVALFTFLLATSSIYAYSAMSASFLPNVKAEGEKETILFDFKNEQAMNDNYLLLNTDVELPAYAETSFDWYVNLETKVGKALESSAASSSVKLAWNGLRPAEGSLPYKHFHIEAGTVIAETSSQKYVLRNDYNFWWTQGSGNLSFRQFVFQHGGTDAPFAQTYEVPSLSFKGDISGGAQPNMSRWLFYVPYEKGTDWSTTPAPSNGNSAYVDRGEGYELWDFNLKSDGFINVESPISSASRGTALMLVKFAPFGTTTGTDLDHRLSLYFPKGHLFGGTHAGYAFMLQEDAYLEIAKDGTLSGVFSTPHDYVKHDAACGHPGNIEYYTCSRHADDSEIFLKSGDTYKATTIDKVQVDVEHSFSFVDEKPFTCDTDGVKAHYECVRCHQEALKEGSDYRLVTADELRIPAAHTLIHHDEIPFSCDTDGKRAYEECSVCHKYYLQDGDSLVEAKESDLLIAKHHVLEIIEGEEATCTQSGLTSGKECSVCDEIIEERKEIAPLGHRYGGWKLDSDEKHISRYCERCYQTETVSITDNDDFTYTVVQEATSYSKGLALYSSDTYGSFYVELPLKEKGMDEVTLQIIIASVVAVFAIGISIGGFFLIKKKFAANK